MKLVLRTSLILLLMAFWAGSCSKPSGGEAPAEDNLVIALDPDPGSPTTPVRAAGATYDFRVVIQSKMPPQGVDVKVEFKKDSESTPSYTQTYPTTTTSPINVSVTGIPFNEVGTVMVTVTSKSKPSNTANKTFKLVRK